MKKNYFFASVFLAAAVLFSACSSEEDEPLTGIKFSSSAAIVEPGSEVTVKAGFYSEDSLVKDVDISISVTRGTTASTTVKSGETFTVTMPSVNRAIAVVTGSCTVDGIEYSAEYNIATKYAEVSTAIKTDDLALGFASIGYDPSKMTGQVTVTTPDELRDAVRSGNKVIFVEGTIDMSEGKLPAEGSKSTDATAAMDAFVALNSSYSTYAAWLKGETAVSSTADTHTSSISYAYQHQILIYVPANTLIIGVGNAVIRGATFRIQSDNVGIRNLTIKDAVDPFPHHENNDGWNSQHDNIAVSSGASNVWIDHCTFEDTLTLGYAANGEKLQVYDGLCDITGSCKNVTVSYSKFYNHDKTMLIGSSDSDGVNGNRTVTLAGNYFLDCVQRLPMVRNTKIHIFNNVYDSASRTNSYAIKNCTGTWLSIENNYFGSVNPLIKDKKGNGIVYAKGNKGLNSEGTESSVFKAKDYYDYKLKTASSDLKTSAGAGICTVTK